MQENDRRVKDISILLMSVFTEARSVSEAWVWLRRYLRNNFDGYTIPYPLQNSVNDLNFVEEVVVQMCRGVPTQEIQKTQTPNNQLKKYYKSIASRI